MQGMTVPIHCQAISWRSVERLVRLLAEQIRADGYRPDLVVAIARGGFVPARLLCDRLGVMALASIRVEHYRGPRKIHRARLAQPLNVAVRGKRVLVVDDLADTGDTFALAVDHIGALGAKAVRTAALHHKLQSHFAPDYCAQRLRRWRWIAYPWARLEDLGALICALPPVPNAAPAALAAELARRHGLRVDPREVADALRLMTVAES